MITIKIERRSSPAHPPPGEFVCGFAERDITPHPDFPLAGFSANGEFAHGVRGHLFARALYLRDAEGEDASLVVVDLLSASRLLLELIAQRTNPDAGLGLDRIFLHGVHTHTAPGWIFGNSLFDSLAGKTAGFDRGLVEWIAGRTAEAIAEAKAGARPGGVAIDHDARIWGVSRNRSVAPFDENADAGDWNSSGPGAGAPPTLTRTQKLVDPRMTVITATHDRGLGVFAFFGCHPTLLGHESKFYGADWPGEAGRLARTAIHTQLGRDAVVAVGIRATGDVNGYRDDLSTGPGLATRVASAVGPAIASVVARTYGSAKPQRIRSWFAEPRISDSATSPDARLGDRWWFGLATLGGSEEGRTVFHALGLAREGRTGDDFSPEDPQHPKERALGGLQRVLGSIFDLDAPTCLPLTALQIGSTLFAGVPGEPTITAAHEIERALLSPAFDAVVVMPCTSEYGGYFATTAEYGLQHYEGATTLWGRYSVPFLRARLAELVSRPPVPVRAETVEFTTRDDRRRFSSTDTVRAGVEPRPQSTARGAGIRIRWTMADGARVVFGIGWWARLEQLVNRQWTPVIYGGRQLDDVHYPFLIQRTSNDLIDADRTEQWILEFERPADLPNASYRVVLAARSGFPGFAVDLLSAG